jgi:L-aspartate oxidase
MRDGYNRIQSDVLVIGAGLAGCACALTLADQGKEVTLLSSADDLSRGNNTWLAQGGIVYQAPEGDPEELERDILTAGWRHNYTKAVRHLARKGPEAVREMLIEGVNVNFDHDPEGNLAMTREGGHSRQRILHSRDFTGRAIMVALIEAVSAHENIRVLTKRTAVDLLTTNHHARHLDYKYNLTNQCAGAYVFNEKLSQVETILAEFTVMATGGAGQVYLHTTNARGAHGAGLSMASRAGARLMNIEYIQFHPTALYQTDRKRFLISEAVRGEGAKLVNSCGEAFMARYDERADLAPRDIVTRAIMEEMLVTGDPYVYLDAASYATVDLSERFPTIHERCKDAGIDMSSEPIPVVPAAHYSCGGILTDLQGRTTLDRLYAIGECACTGVHGANRLASTSLMEATLWGVGSGRDIGRRLGGRKFVSRKLHEAIPDWRHPGENRNEDPALIAQDWAALRNTMWNYVGISRTTTRLRRAFEDLRNLRKHLGDMYRATPISKPLVDLFQGSLTAYLITLAALRNKQSLGCHHRVE